MIFEYILKNWGCDEKELQIEEITSSDKKGQHFNSFIILFYHYISILICNIITEYVINSVMIIEYLVLSSSYFLHAC